MLARAQQDLRAGDGDSFNSSTLSLRTHSIQSSLLTRRVAIHAWQSSRHKHTDDKHYTPTFWSTLYSVSAQLAVQNAVAAAESGRLSLSITAWYHDKITQATIKHFIPFPFVIVQCLRSDA